MCKYLSIFKKCALLIGSDEPIVGEEMEK